MKLTENRKKELIKEIIVPVMAEKGLTLKECSNGIWEWEKDMDGVMAKVKLWDIDGSLSLDIGSVAGGVGRELLETMEHPRTKWKEWTYCLYSEEKQLQLYENILLDMRDILVVHCDAILEKKAEEERKDPLKRRHFEQLRDHYDQLAAKYQQKLGIEGKGLLEICEAIAEQVRVRRERPIEEVEGDLVGYAALLESELLRQYGGKRRIDEEKGSIVLSEVGHKMAKRSFNVLADIFRMWKLDGKIELWEKEIREFQDRNQKELMKGYNNFVNKHTEETTAADVLGLIRQKKDFNRIYGIAMERAVKLLQEDVFAGEYFPGELLERIPEMDASFFELYSDELKAIVKDALEKCKNYEWLFDEQEGWFLDIVKAISKKL